MREFLEQLWALCFVFGSMFVNPILYESAKASDPRYTLTEYTMNGCPACERALKDVNELISAGFDVRCVNTDVDKSAAEEARRFQLRLRPAWRLAKSDGAEVGRWYGYGKAGIIAATICAKFPTPDGAQVVTEEPAPIEEEPAVEETTEAQTEEAPKPQLAEPVPTEEEEEEQEEEKPATLAEFDKLLGGCVGEVCAAPLADFRDRAPVSERWLDAGFLDDAQNEWDSRGGNELDDEDEDVEEDVLRRRGKKEEAPKEEEEESTNARLGDRAIDRGADRILKGVEPFLEKFEKDALKELGKIGNDATRAVSVVISTKFEAAEAELRGRLDDAVAEIKAAILKEISDAIHQVLGLIGKVVLIVGAVVCVCAFLWWKVKAATAV